MKISRREDIVVIEDGAGARYGLGVFVPALLVGIFFLIIWPQAEGHMRYDLGALMFVVTALALALLRAPRRSEFDVRRRELRLSIGWPPLFGQRKTIPFSSIKEANVLNPVRFGDDLGYARPTLVRLSGERIFLSTYNRSPRRCRRIVDQVQQLLGLIGDNGAT
jgi:hypothetical protein